MFKKNLFTAALVVSISTMALAAGSVELTDANTAKIREMLTEQGYDVGKIKIEDGLYETYAKKDGKKYEVFMDADFVVVKTEVDD
jgi:hypothetical protein